MTECIFCKIVRGEMPCHKIYEDADYLAFLSIFPNTAGFSVVIPKQHYSSYAFDLPDDVRPENISGEFRDGMLYVHMTKTMPTSAQPLEIEIK